MRGNSLRFFDLSGCVNDHTKHLCSIQCIPVPKFLENKFSLNLQIRTYRKGHFSHQYSINGGKDTHLYPFCKSLEKTIFMLFIVL